MVLRNVGVRQLALAQVASQIADWAGRLALAILVFDRLNRAWAVGLVGAMFFVAWLGPGQRLSSWLARFGTRQSMIGVEILRALVFGWVALPMVPLNGLTLGLIVVVASLADPVFEINRASLAVEVAGSDYGAAVKLLAAVNQIAQLAGYAAGGALLAIANERAAFLAIAVLFGLSAMALSQIPDTEEVIGSESESSLSATRKFFADDRLSLVAMVSALTVVGAAMAIEAIAAVYGAEVGASESGVGIIAAALPAATFVGVAGLKTKAEPVRILARSIWVAGASALTAVGLFTWGNGLLTAAAGYAAVGLALVVSIAGNVVVGTRIPAESRGPVFGVIQGVLYSTKAAAAGVGGLVAQFLGARATNIGAAAVMVVCAVAGLVALRSVPADTEEVFA